MAAQPWHVNLPQFLDQDGFSKAYGSTVIRSQNEIGPDKVRRRSTRPRDLYNVTMQIQASQEPILHEYFNTTLNGGATTFIFTDPITEVVTEWQMMGEPSLNLIGFQTYKVAMSWLRIGDYV